jgi:hypothetical protein
MPTCRGGSFGPFHARRRTVVGGTGARRSAGARIPSVTPLILIVPGLIALAIGIVILRSFGPAYRVARLLAATPVLPLPEVLAMADGSARYVAVQGRVDAEDPFEDEHHRPLVLRRTRLAVLEGRSWRTVDEQRDTVPFQIREGLDELAIDDTALDEGLVVMPRESTGIASEVADRVGPDVPADRQVRLRVELVSAVDHAVVVGVPRRRADGSVHMTAGLGRPLIVSTLGSDEAMRVLAGDDGRRRTLAAAVTLGGGLVLLTLGLAWAAIGSITGVAAAASPSPSAASGGDPRSSGEGPGLVGDPLLAIGLVVLIGLAAAFATYAWVRLTRPSTTR